MTTWPGALSLATTRSAGPATAPMASATASRSRPMTAAMPPSTCAAPMSSPRRATRRMASGASQHAGGDQRGVLADRVPRHEGRLQVHAGSRRCRTQRAPGRRGTWRPGTAASAASGSGAPPALPRRPRSPSSPAPGRPPRRRAPPPASRPARSRPMPTAWEPCGEKRSATAHSSGSSSISSCPYSTGSPASVTRLRTLPLRGARTSCRTPSISTWPSASPLSTGRPGPNPSA